jgi:elongation factor P
MKASDLKKSSIIEIGGAPHRVEKLQVQTPSARGGACLYKVRFRNVQTGQKVDQSLRGEDTLKEASYETREVQYLYQNGDRYAFMDLTDYSQFELTGDEIDDAVPYLVDDMEGIKALISDGRVLGIVLPDTVELEIVECDPSIKGASATARTKPATLTTGLVVQVPEYIAPGETIRVDTRNNAFLNRV